MIAAALAFSLLAADLAAVKSERDPERRAERALANALSALAETREKYDAGDEAGWKSALGETLASVELARESLAATGKEPRKSRAHKSAELKTRELTRRLTQLSERFGYEDRPAAEKARDRVQQIHDELLESVLAPKAKKPQLPERD